MSELNKQEVEVAKFVLKSFMFLCADLNIYFINHKDSVTPAMLRGREEIRQLCFYAQCHFEQLVGKKSILYKSKYSQKGTIPSPPNVLTINSVDYDDTFSKLKRILNGKGFV
jgi:hypothetical protein